MTKKDYVNLAKFCCEAKELLCSTLEPDVLTPSGVDRIFQKVVLIPLTNVLKQDNPNFDDDGFWDAVYALYEEGGRTK